MRIHAHALLIAEQRRRNDLELRMLAQAALNERIQRLDRNTDHAVFILLIGEAAGALLLGRRQDGKQAHSDKRQHGGGANQGSTRLHGHTIGEISKQLCHLALQFIQGYFHLFSGIATEQQALTCFNVLRTDFYT